MRTAKFCTKAGILTLSLLTGFLIVTVSPEVNAAQYFVKKKIEGEAADENEPHALKTDSDVKPAPIAQPDEEDQSQEEDTTSQVAANTCSSKDKAKAQDLYKKFKSLEKKENDDSKAAKEIEGYTSDPKKFEYMVNLFVACSEYLPEDLAGQ